MRFLKRLGTLLLAMLLLSLLLLPLQQTVEAASMTQYRVYQNDKPLKEFVTQNQAIAYAKYYSYSHVEKISNREWVWHNFPGFKVYIDGASSSKLEFASLEEAKKTASAHINSYVRELQNAGWAYENFANYIVYQGDKTMDGWQFFNLEDAKKEARKWTNAHIIDVSSKAWVWDNLSEKMVKEQRAQTGNYVIYVNGEPAGNGKAYSFLKDAIEAANKLSNSEVINTATNKSVHQNLLIYEVYSQQKLTKKHSTLDAAVKTAKSLPTAEVKLGSQLLWSNVPNLSVYQGEKLLKQFHSLSSALSYAKYYSNSSIQNADGRKLWSAAKNFIYMGWNGSSSVSTVQSHVSNTQGLNITSPTWYTLEDASGKLNDSSNAALVAELAAKGVEVVPLVHNQFNKEMTSQFLADQQAQQLFIDSVIKSLVTIKAKGVNLDFESIAASDRQAFTSFVEQFTTAAHAKKLTVSIDVLRGDVRWNHLTAYDYEALGKIVDYVIVMAYDEHWSGSTEAGSVSSLNWTEEGIKQQLEYGIPRSKLILGVPFYSREWIFDNTGKLIGNRTLLMKDIATRVAENNATAVYDEQAGQYRYTYKQGDNTVTFWAETTDTVLARVALAKKYDLAGVAAWRLGYEDAAVWEAMLKIKEQ